MKYPFTIKSMNVEGHKFFVAESQYLSGCIGQGDTISEAINELEENEIEWLEDAEEFGLTIPPIRYDAPHTFSKTFALRMPNSLRSEAMDAAEKDGVSLNQYIVDALRTKVTYQTTKNIITAETTRTKDISLGSQWNPNNELYVLEKEHIYDNNLN